MDRGHHERIFNECRSLLLSVKLLATLVFLSILAPAQFKTQPLADGAVCPLSESQTQKSIDTFSKISAFITSENRCLGCHGRVNPFIDGTGADPQDPEVPKSEFEHGPGAVDRKADCNECHSKMARRTLDDSESIWTTAPGFLSFVGKDSPTLCKQIRGNLPTAKAFLGHLKDDNGGNNFAGTAFNGDRGLNRGLDPKDKDLIAYPEKEVPTQKPASPRPNSSNSPKTGLTAPASSRETSRAAVSQSITSFA
jgi:hypothetical protein